jgi:hypothetical protein
VSMDKSTDNRQIADGTSRCSSCPFRKTLSTVRVPYRPIQACWNERRPVEAHWSAVDTRSSSDDLPIKPPHVERPGWVGDDASLGGCDWRGKREPRHSKLGKHRPTRIYPIAQSGCVIGMLTSNGILAAASFLVGTAPSKILAHRQATLPLCA